jgi:hypothetical protein
MNSLVQKQGNGVKLGQDTMREKKINKKDEYNAR